MIVGAGQAGIQVSQSLRKRGFTGDIVLLGNEGYPAYQRPPLSKAFLKGDMDEARLFFRQESFYADQNIDLRPSFNAVSIDLANKKVTGESGESCQFKKLVIATGSTPITIPIPGASLPGVHVLRGLADSLAIRERLENTSRLIVVGGGYIGLEVASAARQLGREVTVVERLPRLLSRVTSPQISDFYLNLHRDRGVDVRLEDSVAEILGEDQVNGVKLDSGEIIEAEAVLIGIGVRPNQQLAEAAGIDCDDGILVDAHCRTSAEDVYAAGDCARQKLADGTTLRLESVHNALDQAERIAADIVGDPEPAFDPPWFWSDQYEIKLQTAGLFNNYDDVAIRGDVDAAKFAALYFRDDELIAIDAINDPVSFMSVKQMLKKRIRASKDEALAAETLKDLIAGAAKK
jgi:3-phenylpropionate/trans-cinnamate dioxygenase ferredoxin reductase subunit